MRGPAGAVALGRLALGHWAAAKTRPWAAKNSRPGRRMSRSQDVIGDIAFLGEALCRLARFPRKEALGTVEGVNSPRLVTSKPWNRHEASW